MICQEGVFPATEASSQYSYIVTGYKQHGQAALKSPSLKLIIDILHGVEDDQVLYAYLPHVTSKWAHDTLELVLYILKISKNKIFSERRIQIDRLIETLAYFAGGYIDNNKLIPLETTKVHKLVMQHEPTTFYCLSVPTTAFVVRSHGHISITGNCHVEGMTWLCREIIKENRLIWNDHLKSQIYTIAEKMVELEDKFIDLAFETGGVEGLTDVDVRQYIRYIADRRLIALGMKGIFKVKKNPLPWVEAILNAPEHTNFFELKSTSYARGSMTGSWSDIWK
jgi:ribonucleotide reductase beta subunit family protein with ferritin-like domain